MKTSLMLIFAAFFCELSVAHSQILLFERDTFYLKGKVDTMWLYNHLIDTTIQNPIYENSGYYIYEELDIVQSIFKVGKNDSIGFIIQFHTNGKIFTYQNFQNGYRQALNNNFKPYVWNVKIIRK